ncbi:transcriptional regulator, IclR family [Novosphingobium aromaticivorans DSM 12444]|uniref:Transcriptional regulator, IclR family n=1 Tax=Novosphingobium aromaticivorans (strain ATCC 700278 / DSM 12444 / CCUG 56034 / CIP 105152 / NBRC 16084 / F199) TaxID=279238 RepID=Q2G5K3_NOVAD|nr:IclR family transcriptional regulator [Novosphingobium aromaticivorans]ABD26870.1 transcriptional regulator, IclR family [Novosphingobium aromaticivorans DSM 12444]SCY44175.1 transcriptional regulator, IclR family [Novosphingobium aromaticivorans]
MNDFDDLPENDGDAAGEGRGAGKYRAPALEKGLDVIALLVDVGHPLTMTEICQRLGRSQGEMFRMVQVLQARGFVEQDRATDGYYLTDLLFTMAMRQPPTQSLVEVALPRMRALAMEIGQSCHLVFHSRGEIVVVARMESNEQIGFSVRIGHRLPLQQSVSGTVLFGFQPEDMRRMWLDLLPKNADPEEVAAFVERADAAREKGYARAASSFVSGISDISAPIMRGDRAAAALTVPFIRHANLRHTIGSTTEVLTETARQISDLLPHADSRV